MSRDTVLLDDVKRLFRNAIDQLYDSIDLQIREATLSFKQFCDSAGILFSQALSEVHLHPIASAPSP